MSRIPQSPSARTPSKPRSLAPPASRLRPTSPSKPSVNTATPTRIRTKSTPQSPNKAARSQQLEEEPPVPKTPISIKEAIALKRAEAKKANLSKPAGGNLDDFTGLEEADPNQLNEEESVDELGRLSLKETIERARSTGSVNFSSRDLPCIPSALFEIHLGITPNPLKSVEQEPSIGTSPDPPAKSGRAARRDWEAHDLHIIKAWNNDIIEIQPEISLFGSLKAIDLHQNKLIKLPDSIADLSALTSLDLSHNALTELPLQLFALPNLTTLNVSHNSLTTLAFSAPFSADNAAPTRGRQSLGTSSFFAPVVTHASTPLPKLAILDASHNKFTAASIDHASGSLPKILVKLDLSANPLGDCQSLIVALGDLPKLREARFETADIGDESLPSDLFTSSSLPNIRLLDFGQTRVTIETVQSAFGSLGRELNFDFTTEEPPAGVIRVLVGKKVVKEAWELETERRARLRTMKPQPFEDDSVMAGMGRSKPNQPATKEAWEIEAEQGLLTEGAKRRARAAAAAAEPTTPSSPPKAAPAPTPVVKKEVQKEAWEIEAEQGLLTAGGRRRARAAAAAAAAEGKNNGPSLSRKPSSSGASLTNPQYFSERTQTLTLPPSAPTSKGHARAFSHASSAWSSSPGDQGRLDITLPTPTLPLGIISTQPFAQTLKILKLTNRRLDVSISLPLESETDLLPSLEELNLDGCGLRDTVPVSRQDAASSSGATTPPRSTEPLLPLLAKLFPNLRALDLSDNALSSASLTTDALSALILASDDGGGKKGLKHLRIRGNRLAELDGMQGLTEMFKGNRTVPEWKLEELDLRDNEIGKLPAELGLLPLDVFLVDGNVFRVPQRRVWEREGTKGLLSWLRGRIE